MGKLINLSVYTRNSTQYSPSIQALVQEDWIMNAQAATTAQKQSFPAASANINTWVRLNVGVENAGVAEGLLVGESLGTILSNS